MPDRVRAQNTKRTPSADIPDTIAMFGAQQDIADFAPTMKGGLAAGEADLTIGDGENLQLNPDFEEGIGDWTAMAAPTTLALTTALFTNGTQGLKLIPDGTDLSVGARGAVMGLPQDTTAIAMSFDVYFHQTVTADPRKFAEVKFLDDAGVQVGLLALSDFTPIAFDTWEAVILTSPVPVGATQFQLWKCGVESFAGSNIAVAEYAVIDNFDVIAVPVFTGLVQGAGGFASGIFGLDADNHSLTDTSFTSGLGVYQEWGTGIWPERVSFFKEPSWEGLSFYVEGRVEGRISNLVAAQRANHVRVDISLDNGVTWVLGNVIGFNVGGAAGANAVTVSWSNATRVSGSAVAIAIQIRAVFTQNNGVGNDTTALDGQMFGRITPVKR